MDALSSAKQSVPQLAPQSPPAPPPMPNQPIQPGGLPQPVQPQDPFSQHFVIFENMLRSFATGAKNHPIGLVAQALDALIHQSGQGQSSPSTNTPQQ